MKPAFQQSEGGEVEEEPELMESNDQEEIVNEKKQSTDKIATEEVVKEKKQLSESSNGVRTGKQPSLKEKEKRKKREWPSREEIAKNRYSSNCDHYL